MTLPLHGARFVNLGWVWAGALPAQIFADFGADVIRVESSLRGDIVRITPPLFNSDPWLSCYGLNVHRNQRSVTVNLTTREGVEIVRRLARGADVVLENYRIGFVEQLALGPDDLRRDNPRLVYVRLSAMGEDGPYATMSAYGSTVQSMGGLDRAQGYGAEDTVAVSQSFADPLVGLYGALVTLAAYFRARQTGVGATVTIAQHECVAHTLTSSYLRWASTGSAFDPANRHRRHAPHGLFPCRGEDVWIAIAVRSDDEYQQLAAIVGGGLADDPRFATELLRKEHEDELDALISDYTIDRDRDRMAAEMQAVGVAATPALSTRQLFEHEHYRGRGDWIELDDERGRQVIYGLPWKLSRTPGSVRTPAPTLGEHNDEVFLEMLGLAPDEYERLKSEGVIQ